MNIERLIEKAGLTTLCRNNPMAFLGILIEGKGKLETKDKKQHRELNRYYTILGVNGFKRRASN